MERSNPSAFLRLALIADAVVSGVTGLVMLGLAGPLGPWLGLPASLLFGAGLSFVPFVAFVAAAARPARPRPALVSLVIGANVAWAIACALLAFSGEVTPSALGYGFIAAQAIAVLALAELEWVGLRRAQGHLGGNSRRKSASVGAPT